MACKEIHRKSRLDVCNSNGCWHGTEDADLRPTCPTSCQIERCSYSMQSGFAAYLSFSALGMLDQKSSSDDTRAHDIDRWPFAGNGGQRSRLQWSKASHSCSELGNLKSKNILVSETAARGCMSKSVHERLKWQMRTGRASSGRDNYVRPCGISRPLEC